jgi:hypothetical protein
MHGKIAVIIPGTRPETRPYAAAVVVAVSAVASLATVDALDATAPVTVSDTSNRTPARARMTRKRITAAELEAVTARDGEAIIAIGAEFVSGMDGKTLSLVDNKRSAFTPNAAMPPLTAVRTKINHLFSFIISMILAQNRSLSNSLYDSQNLSKMIETFLSDAIFGTETAIFLPKSRFDRNPDPFYYQLFCQMPFSARKGLVFYSSFHQIKDLGKLFTRSSCKSLSEI